MGLFRGSRETEAGTLRESIITVDSGRLCSWPVPVSYVGMAVEQQKRCAALKETTSPSQPPSFSFFN